MSVNLEKNISENVCAYLNMLHIPKEEVAYPDGFLLAPTCSSYVVKLDDNAMMLDIGRNIPLDHGFYRWFVDCVREYIGAHFDCVKNWAEHELIVIGQTEMRLYFEQNIQRLGYDKDLQGDTPHDKSLLVTRFWHPDIAVVRQRNGALLAASEANRRADSDDEDEGDEDTGGGVIVAGKDGGAVFVSAHGTTEKLPFNFPTSS